MLRLRRLSVLCCTVRRDAGLPPLRAAPQRVDASIG
jgi:hypothetical protein